MPDFRRIDDPSLQAQLAEDYSFWDGMPGHASYRLACGACGKTFYARMPTARWCSDRCAREGAICDRYGIDYDTRALSLPSRDEAERWTIEHQFGRRNLTKYRRAELALKLKLLIFPGQGDRMELCPTLDKVDTKRELANIAGVSHGTIAKQWIIEHQFGRRNVTRYQRSELALKLKPLLEKEARKRMLAGKAPDPAQKSAQGETGEMRRALARIAGVSHDTIAKAEFRSLIPPMTDEVHKGSAEFFPGPTKGAAKGTEGSLS